MENKYKLVLLFSLLSVTFSSAQLFGLSGLPPCVPVLSPCLNYLHTDSPPASCCIPLENAIEEQADCLCTAFHDQSLLAKIKMTQDQMLKFPAKCALSLPETTNCTSTSTSTRDKISPAPSKPPPASPSPPPPSAPSDESGANDSLTMLMLFSAVILPLIAVFHI